MAETTSADLSPALRKGLISLQDGASVAQVAKALKAAMSEDQVREVTAHVKPSVPPVDEITPVFQAALDALPALYGQVQPIEARRLTDAEIEQIAAERDAVAKIETAIAARKERINQTVKNHMDRVAEDEGRADENTLKDKDGHYILASQGNPERCAIPGTSQDFSREFRSGKITLDVQRLKEMYEDESDDRVDRATWLAMTRETRVYDEHRAAQAIIAKPERMQVLNEMVTPGLPGTSLFVRNRK